MAETNEEQEGLLKETDLAYAKPPTDAKSQSDIDKVSETPLWPLNVKESVSILFSLLRSGIPISFAFAAALLRALISLIIVGKYATSKELAGASLATSLGTMLIVTIAYTINAGYVVNASQLNGARKFEELKVFSQRHICVILTIITPLILILSLSNYILIALNVDPAISNYAAEYFRLSILSLIGTCLQDFLKNYLMAQHIYTIIGVAQIIALIVHIPLCILLASKAGIPFMGPAIARSIVDPLAFFIILTYTLWNSKRRAMFTSWARKCLQGWWPHVKQTFVLGFDVFIDNILLEFSLLIVIFINDEHVISAHSIAINICGVLFVIPLGNSLAMQTKMGNAVGENLKHKAKKFMAGGLFLNLLVCCFLAAVIFIWNESIINLMTNIPETNAILRDFLYIYNVVYLGDSYKDHLAGILKVIGKEADVMKIFMCCNIAIGLISQWVLSLLLGVGYLGIWFGVAIAMYSTCGSLITRLTTLDLDKEIESIQERLEKFDKEDDL